MHEQKTPFATTLDIQRPTAGAGLRLLAAFTRAFPYAGIEYVIFLAVLENSPALAWVMGVLALIGGAGLVALHVMRTATDQVPTWEQRVETWFGDVLAIALSVICFGLGLLSWAHFHSAGGQFFSGLAIVALVGAMLLVVYANFQRKEVRS